MTLTKRINGWWVIASLIISNAAFLLMLNTTLAQTSTMAGGKKILDMMPGGYSIDYVNDLFEALGPAGRDYYLSYQLPFDFVYPFLFAFSGLVAISYFLKYLSLSKTKWIWLIAFPLLAGIADYAENFGIINLLKTYPDIRSFQVNLTAGFSIIKSSTSTLYWISFLVLLIVFLIRKTKGQSHK